MIITWSTIMYMTAYSAVFLDLYLTIKNPFYPRRKRMSIYITVLVFAMITSGSILIATTF